MILGFDTLNFWGLVCSTAVIIICISSAAYFYARDKNYAPVVYFSFIGMIYVALFLYFYNNKPRLYDTEVRCDRREYKEKDAVTPNGIKYIEAEVTCTHYSWYQIHT